MSPARKAEFDTFSSARDMLFSWKCRACEAWQTAHSFAPAYSPVTFQNAVAAGTVCARPAHAIAASAEIPRRLDLLNPTFSSFTDYPILQKERGSHFTAIPWSSRNYCTLSIRRRTSPRAEGYGSPASASYNRSSATTVARLH